MQSQEGHRRSQEDTRGTQEESSRIQQSGEGGRVRERDVLLLALKAEERVTGQTQAFPEAMKQGDGFSSGRKQPCRYLFGLMRLTSDF